jgi:polyisoprenoid-binding protein YceI
MRRVLTSITLALCASIMLACAADPAANSNKATVGTATNEASPAKAGQSETLPITPENSKVDFVASKVTRSHNGSFKKFSGTIDLAPNVTDSRVTVAIDTGSVVADDDGLTKHLQTPDFFDVGKFPKATFVSTKIEPNTAAGATHTVTGNFDLHGVKKSISFPANIQSTADSVSVNAEFSINRKDFGIAYAGKADDLIRDGVVIKLTIKAPRTKK